MRTWNRCCCSGIMWLRGMHKINLSDIKMFSYWNIFVHKNSLVVQKLFAQLKKREKSGFTLRDCTITKAVWEVWPALAEAGWFVYFISHFGEQTAKNELKSKTESVCWKRKQAARFCFWPEASFWSTNHVLYVETNDCFHWKLIRPQLFFFFNFYLCCYFITLTFSYWPHLCVLSGYF